MADQQARHCHAAFAKNSGLPDEGGLALGHRRLRGLSRRHEALWVHSHARYASPKLLAGLGGECGGCGSCATWLGGYASLLRTPLGTLGSHASIAQLEEGLHQGQYL